MDMYKLKFTPLQLQIFNLFCIKTGKKLSQRQISRILNVSSTAIAKSLPELQKQGLVKINKHPEMNLNLIEFNRDNQKAIYLKRAKNLEILYQSDLVEFLIDNHPGCTIILFGSYAKGEDLFNSDIDLVIIGTKKTINLKQYEKILEKEIRINYYQTFKEIHKHLKENLCNGIILSGGIEL